MGRGLKYSVPRCIDYSSKARIDIIKALRENGLISHNIEKKEENASVIPQKNGTETSPPKNKS
ncbi:hypothetical protein HZS_4852 [Henneguya salminicola]|nr:hypothetical protein HZS_4852 [Henneguya salminicola]